MTEMQTVFIVDDDRGMRGALGDYLRSAKLNVETFDSARSFLAAYVPSRPGCLILDIRMPGMTGLELQEHLVLQGVPLPILVVSAHAQVADAVKSMKLGSFEFIEKPYASEFLLKRVREALEHDQRTRSERSQLAQARECFKKLTEREKEILRLVVAGKQSKRIADLLELSVSTVDNHRANIMRKLSAETSADLTRIALLIDPGLAFSRSAEKSRG
jgi:two-component system, LuxR family, response regulator FixJ